MVFTYSYAKSNVATNNVASMNGGTPPSMPGSSSDNNSSGSNSIPKKPSGNNEMTPPDNNNTNSGQNSNQGTPPEKPSDDNGTPPVKPDDSTNSSENSSTNNNEMNGMPNNGNASIGYSFVIYGTTSREKAQAYTNSSDIKTYLDTWYENNIKGTNYEKYITDNIFCNDRSTKNTQNDGYGPEHIAYRLASRPWATRSSKNSNKNMMLTCPCQVDTFTVDDTTNGNGALTYKMV